MQEFLQAHVALIAAACTTRRRIAAAGSARASFAVPLLDLAQSQRSEASTGTPFLDAFRGIGAFQVRVPAPLARDTQHVFEHFETFMALPEADAGLATDWLGTVSCATLGRCWLCTAINHEAERPNALCQALTMSDPRRPDKGFTAARLVVLSASLQVAGLLTALQSQFTSMTCSAKLRCLEGFNRFRSGIVFHGKSTLPLLPEPFEATC
ncbi:unnamed protein product [Symbiodinium necroappetens]|uniref:Uncharacterized protein n=1 Tax=Symbiodinium necroappetens TaxID=1628268 RepID=A0A812TYM2_9DINO|nr:unnamed protein product [Symbiodinium necroappetens]